MTLPVSYTTVSLMLMTVPAAGSVTAITSAHFAEYGGRAQALVNAKIARMYDLPFTLTPPLIEAITTDIACYYLLTRRVFTQSQMNESEWPDRFKEAADWLDEVARGELSLVDSADDLVEVRADIAQAWSDKMGYHPTFSELGDLEQVVDPDKVDDLKDDRDL